MNKDNYSEWVHQTNIQTEYIVMRMQSSKVSFESGIQYSLSRSPDLSLIA